MTWNDEKLDTVVGITLRTGVIIAAVLVLIGGIAWLASHAGARPDHHSFHGAPDALTHIHTIVTGAAGLHPLFLIQFGLVVLIATPVIRVIICAAGFAFERDWLYTVISLIVLGLLMYSVAGHGG